MSGTAICQNSSTVSEIYNSRNILLDLAERRGYDVEDYSGFTINEVQSMCLNRCLDMLIENPDTKKKIYYKYHIYTKIRHQQVWEYIDELFNVTNTLSPEDDLIIVVKDRPNDGQIKLMSQIWNQENLYVNIIDLHNYLFNILEHELVPPHEVLNEEDKKDVMKNYNIVKESQFPEISRYDPVAQAIGLRPNSLCKIMRSSPTAIKTEYYRMCYP
tara:strand:+ start:409 stop:1053 length:645 start_codon:yes stop_codon:yes gene_type:complete